jgi:hypothetical protein
MTQFGDLHLPLNRQHMKIRSILLEYALAKNHIYVGSGLGGNISYLAFIYDKEPIVTTDIETIDIRGNAIIYNPDFIEKATKAEIRTHLDAIIKDKIEKEGFKSTIYAESKTTTSLDEDIKIDPALIGDMVKNIDIDPVLLEGKKLPEDVFWMDLENQLFVCIRLCARFADLLDKTDPQKPDLKLNQTFYDAINFFDIETIIISIRTQITMNRIIKYNLDEDPILGRYFAEINTILES